MLRLLTFRFFAPLLILLGCTGMARAEGPALVGRVVEIMDHFLPGPELQAKPSQGLADPLVLRIAAVYPHGTAGFRYDFSCVPMVAGKYDLTKFLVAPPGAAKVDLPPLMLEASGVMPDGPPGMLAEPEAVRMPKLGGYERLIPFGIALWVLAGSAIFWFLRKRTTQAELIASLPPPSLAQRLQPILERACKQPLGTEEKAELERLLLAHGREKLGLAYAADPIVWQTLRTNPETSNWLGTLENWLHAPATSAPSEKELNDLLTAIKKSA